MERIFGNAPELRDLFPTSLGNEERIRVSLWSTPESLADHCAAGNRETHWEKSSSHWRESPTPDHFTHAKSMAHATQICRAGWPEGAARAERIRDKINAANPIGKRLAKWAVAGAYPSVPRALAGDPCHMRALDSSRLRRRPIITLMSDFADSGMVSADAITNRAAVVAAIVDKIEASGYACNVVGFEASTQAPCRQLCVVNIKDSDQPADIGRMAFALGHAAMFRRLCWYTISEDHWISGLGSGFGIAARYKFDADQNIYLLPAAGTNESSFKTEDLAATDGLAYLVQSLRQQGCPAFPQDDGAE